MQKLGDIVKGTDIGYSEPRKYIWAACEICGKERWVMYRVRAKEARNTICADCVVTQRVKGIKCLRCGTPTTSYSGMGRYCPACRQYLKRIGWSKTLCRDCGKSIKRSKSGYCRQCRYNHPEFNPGWKRGYTYDRQGHILVKVAKRSTNALTGGIKKSGYLAQHRLIWQQTHGHLPIGYIIHHLNGIPDDNRLENLVALPTKSHSKILRAYQNRIRALENIIKGMKNQHNLL